VTKLSRINATHLLMACLLIGLSTLTAVAQTKPSFSGVWKMNPQKTKLAGNSSDGIAIEFNHKDNDLTEAFTVLQVGDEYTIDAKYAIGGKESEVPIGDQVIKATAMWEGDELVIDWRGPEAGRYNIRKLTLSPDGKTMTVNLKHSLPDGGMSEKTWILQKQ
jgi:hypothetical protein